MKNEETRLKARIFSFLLPIKTVPLWNSLSYPIGIAKFAPKEYAENQILHSKNLARQVLRMGNVFRFNPQKMASLEQGVKHISQKLDPTRHISPVIAHELNNILTIIQGYADRLLFKHGDDQALQPHLKVISEASRRAATIVREATPPTMSQSIRQIPPAPSP
ncbi:MAG: histidine kinase dimerization/phospho-acceptor domain-containing protein [Limisphaerales bacterium]